MNAPLSHPLRAANAAALLALESPEEKVARKLYEIIGPAETAPPQLFQCGAPWTGHATDPELARLGKLQGRIDRRERALKELRKERTKIMMRCIRRMRRSAGVEA